MLFTRLIEREVEKKLFLGKVVIVYGARRVGKTTLVKNILGKYPENSLYLNCDEPDVRQALTNKTSTELLAYIGQPKLVVIDEAQRVQNIGLTLKLLVDNAPKIQIIATGSSSFDLANKINEPLTGRSFFFELPPLFLLETSNASNSSVEINRLLENRLIYGLYPEVVVKPSLATEILRGFYKNYLYKDILDYQGIKNPDLLEKLLSALALQVSNEVSFTELANLVGIDQKTIATYIRILEQIFVIFRLPPLSRNLRKEINKSRKIYFWDTGIRNTVINNFNPLSLRSDTGQLWENFIIAERQKRNLILQKVPNRYFWRTWSKSEIDYIEEEGGILSAYEIKWQKKASVPKLFSKTYPNSTWELINKTNFLDFLQI